MRHLEDYSMTQVAYETLATEIIMSRLDHFEPSIEWCDQFEALDDSNQVKLRNIDEQIQRFAGLEFFPDEVRLQRLLMVFFDCYLGFQQQQDIEQTTTYVSLIREPWQRRFRKYRAYQPTNKKILCANSGSIGYSIRLNTRSFLEIMQTVALVEGKSIKFLKRELGEFLRTLDHSQYGQMPSALLSEVIQYIKSTTIDKQKADYLTNELAKSLQTYNMPTDIQTPTDLLKVILGYIKLTSSGFDWSNKVDLHNDLTENMWDIVDFMTEVVQAVNGRITLGGTAPLGAEALAYLGEPKVHLLISSASEELLKLLSDNLKILWYITNSPEVKLQIHEPREFIYERLNLSRQPEMRNFIVEFSAGNPIVYCPTCGEGVVPYRTDQLIIRSQYAHYLPDGRIDRRSTQLFETQRKIRDLFGFDSEIAGTLSQADRIILAEQAADNDYDLLVLNDLQNFDGMAHSLVEQELELFYDRGTKIHIELSGIKNFQWLIRVIDRYIFSVGVGEELGSLFHAVKVYGSNNELFEALRFERLEADLQAKPRGYRKAQLALAVTSALNLERLYVHDVDMDIIIRKGEISMAKRLEEIQANIIAKWVMLRKLMSRGEITQNQVQDTMTQIKEESFIAISETAQPFYEDLVAPPDTSIELYGTYSPLFDCTIILVPVRWVYGFGYKLRIEKNSQIEPMRLKRRAVFYNPK